jgi:hypothetical protein
VRNSETYWAMAITMRARGRFTNEYKDSNVGGWV